MSDGITFKFGKGQLVLKNQIDLQIRPIGQPIFSKINKKIHHYAFRKHDYDTDITRGLTNKQIQLFASILETHVSLVSFSQQENMLHSFKDKQTITAIHNTIEHLTHPGGGTNMTAVFGEARDLFSNAKGGRSHVTRVLVLVSDGDYQSKFAPKEAPGGSWGHRDIRALFWGGEGGGGGEASKVAG